MRLRSFFAFSFILLILFSFVGAGEEYSYENAERLTPLIEWRDYGPEAFSEAINENKPIFLLLTAPSWCYWCQVYESEDYLFHPDVVIEINNNFIPIYVDADKRQDLTRKHLEGGWPSTTVMTPDRTRLFGFSGVRPVANMLANLRVASEYVSTYKSVSSISYDYEYTEVIIPTEGDLNRVIEGYAGYILQAYDSLYGGFGNGQKFPQGRSLDFSLEMYDLTGDERFLEIALNTLLNQYTDVTELETNYNLFDPVEGGFHRYGTRRDWTPPHYEKMLYDNVKLLRAYSHLLKITPDDALVQEVVTKTDNYITDYWYDSVGGGFYGNTDVFGEEEYYGKNPRALEKPRVEKTKYTDWNSEAVLTYLYLWEITGEEVYRERALKTLDFFLREVVTEDGAYHFVAEDGSRGVRGTLLDNSYMLLALVEGYRVLGNSEYLEAAVLIADYSLDTLYDWNSGGFFERNSPDIDLYAPGENVDLSKPLEENGVISYALLKLFVETGDSIYLSSGVTTFGNKAKSAVGLDRRYYFAKSAQYMKTNNLLVEFSELGDEVRDIEALRQADFWVTDLLEKNSGLSRNGFSFSDEGLEKLEGPFLLLFFVALFSGFISFASPCTLPILPAYVAYTFKSSQKNIKAMTLFFFLGLSFVFVILGMTATFIGKILQSNITIFSQVAGIGIIFFGIYILLGKGFKGLGITHKKPVSYFGSFVFGGILGISWTPCVGPILVAILLLASTSSSVFVGGILLFGYAIGLALPLVLLSTYLSGVDKKGRIWRIIKGKVLHIQVDEKVYSVHTNSLISGVIFIILGYLIYSGILFSFNQYVATGSFQQWIFWIEEKILGLFR